jgi:hypothetical protein
VITGRVVDSALALGPLIHEFGWDAHDYDSLAAGTLAGHLLECGAQVTGGTFTDWRSVPAWENIGFPIGECHADGSLVITKPAGTGGLVNVGTVAEQLLYEVSDPADYIVTDVRCDFSHVKLEEIGADRVRVCGARGFAPTETYKVCITYDDGWRAIAYQPLIGEDATAKAERQAAALFARTRVLLRARGLRDFTATSCIVIGAERSFGAHAQPGGGREVICKLSRRSSGETRRRSLRSRAVDRHFRHVGRHFDQPGDPRHAGDGVVPVPHAEERRHPPPDPGRRDARPAGHCRYARERACCPGFRHGRCARSPRHDQRRTGAPRLGPQR